MSLAALPKKLAIITASTRPNRVGPQVVDIVHKIFENTDVKLRPEMEVLDIADYKLPVFDEEVLPANVPAMGELKGEGARKWSAAMKYVGFVFCVERGEFEK
jgi:NAD(P)H-dependent FMN reductase